MTNISDITRESRPGFATPPSSSPIPGFEPENLIGCGYYNQIIDSRKCSVINGNQHAIYQVYNHHVLGGVGGINISSGNFSYWPVSNIFMVFCSSGIYCTGDFVAYRRSDKKLKDNIRKLKNCLSKIKKISSIYFDWNENQQTYRGRDIGLIAQEVESEFPQAVCETKEGYKKIDYQKMIPVLVSSIQEQEERINKIKQKIKNAKL